MTGLGEGRTSPASTAHHEAGHAVVAVVLGITIKQVSIAPNEESLGNCIHPDVCQFGYRGAYSRRRIARDCIIVSYAGVEAEKIFDSKAEEWCSLEDEGNAFNLSREFSVLPRGCRCVGDEAHLEFLAKLQSEARRLVRKHWPAVEALADALIQKQRVSGEEASRIIEDAISASGQG